MTVTENVGVFMALHWTRFFIDYFLRSTSFLRGALTSIARKARAAGLLLVALTVILAAGPAVLAQSGTASAGTRYANKIGYTPLKPTELNCDGNETVFKSYPRGLYNTDVTDPNCKKLVDQFMQASAKNHGYNPAPDRQHDYFIADPNVYKYTVEKYQAKHIPPPKEQLLSSNCWATAATVMLEGEFCRQQALSNPRYAQSSCRDILNNETGPGGLSVLDVSRFGGRNVENLESPIRCEDFNRIDIFGGRPSTVFSNYIESQCPGLIKLDSCYPLDDFASRFKFNVAVANSLYDSSGSSGNCIDCLNKAVKRFNKSPEELNEVANIILSLVDSNGAITERLQRCEQSVRLNPDFYMRKSTKNLNRAIFDPIGELLGEIKTQLSLGRMVGVNGLCTSYGVDPVSGRQVCNVEHASVVTGYSLACLCPPNRNRTKCEDGRSFSAFLDNGDPICVDQFEVSESGGIDFEKLLHKQQGVVYDPNRPLTVKAREMLYQARNPDRKKGFDLNVLIPKGESQY